MLKLSPEEKTKNLLLLKEKAKRIMALESYKLREWYLYLLEKFQVRPNFWCSLEYFNKADLSIVQLYGEGFGVMDSFTDSLLNESITGLLFPPIDEKKGLFRASSIWADFEGFKSFPGVEKSFLDYEYIYDPKAFLDMSGKKWLTFRKNSRKFSRKFPWEYRDFKSEDSGWLNNIMGDWLDGCEDEEIHDARVMLRYLHEGENRKVLIAGGIPVGINIWDENYRFINFRYCICKDIPFLSEFMRWLFYTDEKILSKNKLVNDGGVLDRPGLKTFKDKMNPAEVREVYSWGLGGENAD